MLVPFPIALWIFSLICDVIYAMGWGGTLWNEMALYAMAAGIIGGLAAAVPGLVDYFSMTEQQPKKIAKAHMILNITLVTLYMVNLWLRVGGTPGARLPIVLSGIGMIGLSVSGWLGGELVYVHGIGVETSAAKSAAGDPSRRHRQS
jgi:uncharacterized membrane protein